MKKCFFSIFIVALSLILINQLIFKATAPIEDFPEANENGNYGFEDERYGGNGELMISTRTINYATKKVVEDYQIPFGLPCYFGEADKKNCASVSGAIILGYYDRFCEDLIPNYKTYRKSLSKIIYKEQESRIICLIDNLEYYMQDGNTDGATLKEYRSGLNGYCFNAGYTYRDESIFTSDKFNMQKYKAAITNKKPVTIFLGPFTLINITEQSGKATINKGYDFFTHIVTCYGYYKCEYYDKNGKKVYTADCLKVATGFQDFDYSLLSLESLSNIQNAISVTIE